MNRRTYAIIVSISLAAFAGCETTHTVKLTIRHKALNEPIPSAVAVLQRRDSSMLNSKTLTEELPVAVDGNGNVVLNNVRSKDTIIVKANGFSSALVGIHDRKTLSSYTPSPKSGRPFPAAVTTNISAIMIVVLVPKDIP